MLGESLEIFGLEAVFLCSAGGDRDPRNPVRGIYLECSQCIAQQMERGANGRPLVDLRAVLTDGKAHSVDSSDMAFQTAGALGLKEAAKSTQIHLLEPVDEVAVLVADEYVGAVMSDLSSRRGRVSGTEPAGNGRSLVKAEVPEIEISRYALDLRSISHGTGSFSRSYLRHEPMPHSLAQKVQATAEAED